MQTSKARAPQTSISDSAQIINWIVFHALRLYGPIHTSLCKNARLYEYPSKQSRLYLKWTESCEPKCGSGPPVQCIYCDETFSHAEIQDHVDKCILWVNDDLWNLRYLYRYISVSWFDSAHYVYNYINEKLIKVILNMFSLGMHIGPILSSCTCTFKNAPKPTTDTRQRLCTCVQTKKHGQHRV